MNKKNLCFLIGFLVVILLINFSSAEMFSYTITAIGTERFTGTNKTLFTIDTPDYHDGISTTNAPGQVYGVDWHDYLRVYSDGRFSASTSGGSPYGLFNYTCCWSRSPSDGLHSGYLKFENPFPDPSNLVGIWVQYLGNVNRYPSDKRLSNDTFNLGDNYIGFSSEDDSTSRAYFFFRVIYRPIYEYATRTATQSGTATITVDDGIVAITPRTAYPSAQNGGIIYNVRYTVSDNSSNVDTWLNPTNTTLYACVDANKDNICDVFQCQEDQLILRLSNEQNAHGELWNEGTYDTSICFNSIFGSYYTGSNPHTCTGSNTVLKLSDFTNAHAQIPSLSTYPQTVCFGNLQCSSVTSPQTCSDLGANYKEVVKLFSTDNAHLALATSSSSYTVKICCYYPPTGPQCGNGIVESGEECDMNDLDGETCLTKGFDSGTLACKPAGDAEQCKFDTTNCTSVLNLPPIVNIIQPVSCTYPAPGNYVFNVGENVQFNVDITEPNGESYNCSWEFGDGQKSDICNAVHVYSEGGVYDPKIIVTDIRNNFSSDSVRILIDDPTRNDPPLPVISNPFQNQFFQISKGANIFFNASCSVDDSTPITDLVFNWSFDDGISYGGVGLTGYNVYRPFSDAGPHFATLSLSDGSLANKTWINFSIEGCRIGITNNYVFKNSCYRDKLHFCDDSLQLFNTISDGKCQGIDGVNGTADDCCPVYYFCNQDDGKCYREATGCERYSNEAECEDNYCIWTDSGVCSESTSILSCSDYPTEQICNEDPIGVGNEGGGFGTEICGTTQSGYMVTNCSCLWTSANRCELNATLTPPIINSGNEGSCNKYFTLSECVDSFNTLTWEATPNSDLQDTTSCTDGSKLIACGSLASKLPFFSATSLIIAIVLVSLYYWLNLRKKKMFEGK